MQSKSLTAALALTLLTGLWSAHARAAGPTSTVYSPIVSYREWELELRAGSQDWAQPGDGEQATKLAVGYGLAPRWFTEAAVESSRVPGGAARIESMEWENIFQLTEHGRYWLDAGIFAGYEYNRIKGEREIKLGPMLQKESGRSVYNLNVTLAQRVGARTPGEAARSAEIDYAAQWRWRSGNELFNPGLQAFGGLGHVDRPQNRGLRAGPALFGKADLGGGRKFRYSVALLAGVTADAPNTTVKFQLEYEFF